MHVHSTCISAMHYCAYYMYAVRASVAIACLHKILQGRMLHARHFYEIVCGVFV
jgi:hypothetical protein